MFFRMEVDHSGADLKLDLLEEGITDLGQQWIQQGAQITEAELSANTPVKKGVLRASIRAEISPFRAEIFTSAGYGKAVNDGWPPRIIRAVRGRALRFEINGKVFFRKQVFHPGFAGHHFKEKTLAAVVPKLIQLAESLLADLKARVGG